MRLTAARAIPQDLGRAGVIDGLLGALKDPDPRVRAAVATKLRPGEVNLPGDRPATPYGDLHEHGPGPSSGRGPSPVRALDDSRPVVRGRGGASLARLPRRGGDRDPAPDGSAPRPGPDRSSRGRRCPRRVRPGSESPRLLLGILANPDDGSEESRLTSFNAARALAAIGGDARAKMLRLLTGQLNSLDDTTRQRAEHIVNELRPRVTDELFRVLSDPRSPQHVRVEVLGILFGFLRDGSSRQLLAARLHDCTMRTAVPALRSLALDEDAEVRCMALSLLAFAEPANTKASASFLESIRNGDGPDLEGIWTAFILQPAMIPAPGPGPGGPGDQGPDRDRERPDEPGRSAIAGIPGRGQRQREARDRGAPARRTAASARASRPPSPTPTTASAGSRPRAWARSRTRRRRRSPALIGLIKTGTNGVPSEDVEPRSFREWGQEYFLGKDDKGDDLLRVAAIQGLAGFGAMKHRRRCRS